MADSTGGVGESKEDGHVKTLKSHGFSVEDTADLRAAFKMFDKDGDGHISAKELKEALKTMGLEPTEEELKMMLSDADTNHSGDLDFDQFVKMMANQMENSESIINTFENEDFITVAELKHVMLALGEDLSENDLQEMIEEADINGDGKLNYKEFVAMIVQSV
mmetsp:Transcript_11372/g.15903  ORF Transcript_11372/g.15903 Transcript_11372/m.15903 type:complete len:163 (-) Transcript_11372:534-1022(-)